MKKINDYQTTAVKRAARGVLNDNDYSTRANTVYGFKNHALQLSGDELKSAWKKASSSIKIQRG